jgi:hypothetical protein
VEAEKFYELKVAGKQVLLRIRPPEKGKKANLSDIQRELHQRDIAYRHETLFDIYRRASNEFEPLAMREATDYEVLVEVAPDAMQAWLTVIPPEVGEVAMDPAKVKTALEASRVDKGILYDEIRRILRDKVENQRLLIAQGRARVHGQDGRLEFQARGETSPTVDENTVDFRELNRFNNVKAGELIARIIPPVQGSDGFTVRAQTLKAKPGRKAKARFGRNARVSEDGTEILAMANGYVVRSGDRISVEDVLEVANVNAETGNLHFHGVVRVTGQVEDAYVVEGEKGIEVHGTVGKAQLRTKGDIRVIGGALGATLVCEGSVFARFLSECTVKAGASVIVDEYILHSQVVAQQAVEVKNEPKGFISGGMIKAGADIRSPIVGSEASEERTVLEVGSGVDVRKRYEALQERIQVNLDVFEKMRKNLLYLQRQRETEGLSEPAKREVYDRLVASGQKLRNDLLGQARQHHALQQAVSEPHGETGFVIVSGVIHPGVSLLVQKLKHTVRDSIKACGFTVIGGELKALPYVAALKLHKQVRGQAAGSES